MKKIVLGLQGLCILLFFPLSTFAMSVDWGGGYRFEYVQVDNTYINTDRGAVNPDRGTKGYFLNHLNLSPKIIALDGVNIVTNFEVFPSSLYPSLQVGTDFGSTASTNTSYNGNQNQGTSSIEVNQLYINWNHEYGAFVAGRAPIQFGLGMTHNAGTGLFDHWNETHDFVGYKFLIGNLSIMPMIGKSYRGTAYAQGAVSTDQMWDIEYANPETESSIGVFHQVRSSGSSGNDGAVYFKPQDSGTPTIMGGWNTTLTSLYLSRGWEAFKFKMEAGFQSGGTGVQYSTAGSSEIKLSGYGIATEMEFPRPDSKLQWSLRMGIATGDDPRTNNFEGFFFNKNYNISFLLFNHPMGANNYDVLRTKLNRQRSTANSVYANDQTVDEETISNTMYVSPKLMHNLSDKWDMGHVLTYAQVQANPSSTRTDVASDLGFEYDISFIYKPHAKFQWVNEVGFFLPGMAWKEGGANRDLNSFTYGFQSKAAISF